MKYLKLTLHEMAALCIIISSVIIRLLLISQNWTWTDSDEGTFGIMARHIAYRGAHPIFMYGAFYMGALQAYIGAIMFHLFGPSLFSLRLGLILLFVLFLIGLYLLTRTLYSKGLALVTILLLSFGSNYLLTYQLRAYGGYPETLLFGTMTFLIASWLAISSKLEVSFRSMCWRCFGYAAWGLAAGLGIWSDQIILPFVAMSGLLLLLFCWREFLRIVPALCLLVCFAIGLFPLIYYNLHALPGQNSLNILLGLQGHNRGHSSLIPQIIATFQVSLPTITGNPFCPVNELPVLGDPTSPHTLSCTLIHSGWSFGYLALFAYAGIVAVWSVWHVWRSWREQKGEYEARQNLARHIARLLLLASAFLAIFLFVSSSAPLTWPGNKARYMIGVLIATPVLIWPLWQNALTITHKVGTLMRVKSVASILVIVFVGSMYLIGTIFVFGEVPTAQAYNTQNQALVTRLESIHATHFYGGYWTCDKLTFLSQEKIICAVAYASLKSAYNRYEPYAKIVSADPQASYVFPESDYRVVVKHWVQQNPAKYRVIFLDGFYIVQPGNYSRGIRPQHRKGPAIHLRPGPFPKKTVSILQYHYRWLKPGQGLI